MCAATGSAARWPEIPKDLQALPVRPNLEDYDAACAGFSWEQARQELSRLPGGGLNIAHEAVDRHTAGPRASRDALRFVRADGSVRAVTYAELAQLTDRFASVLRELGVGRGERVFSVLGCRQELYAAALGALKHGAVFCPLFSAFGPEPVRMRLHLDGGRGWTQRVSGPHGDPISITRDLEGGHRSGHPSCCAFLTSGCAGGEALVQRWGAAGCWSALQKASSRSRSAEGEPGSAE